MMMEPCGAGAAAVAVYRPKIKICGLFREEDIGLVNEAGPDYAGFVFAPSRRRVTAEKAARLREGLAPGIVPVGVFVNAPAEEIARLYRDGVIALAQLHGEEDGAYIAGLKARCDVPVIQVIKNGGNRGQSPLAAEADYLLFDGPAGGSGQPFDWGPLRIFRGEPGRYHRGEGPAGKPWFLAGGINIDTIDKARELRPYGVDVSSGAESGGVKDRDKVIALVEKVREYKP